MHVLVGASISSGALISVFPGVGFLDWDGGHHRRRFLNSLSIIVFVVAVERVTVSRRASQHRLLEGTAHAALPVYCLQGDYGRIDGASAVFGHVFVLHPVLLFVEVGICVLSLGE